MEKNRANAASKLNTSLVKADMGLYVHIPFCLRRCRYCSFFSTGGLGEKEQAAYVEALLAEGAMALEGLRQKNSPVFGTVYLGGGTPVYLTLPNLERLLQGLGALFWPKGFTGKEFTVEANPGVLNKEKLALLKAWGVNRLSLGAQSFDDSYLAWLGRSHSAADFEAAWCLAREAGFDNLNLDLMYGLKGQSLSHWRKTLTRALKLRPEHISLYQLNIEEGTPLARELGTKADYALAEEEGAEQFLAAHRLLEDAGYLHYEISNYALPGRESRHNLRYWHREEYLGLGAGAAGFLGGVRYTNHRNLKEYQKAVAKGENPRGEEEKPGFAERREEALLLGLRLAEGVALAAFYREFGIDLGRSCSDQLEAMEKAGLLIQEKGRLRPTAHGMLVNNELILRLLREMEE